MFGDNVRADVQVASESLERKVTGFQHTRQPRDILLHVDVAVDVSTAQHNRY
jgi:hypothetical protein